VLLVKQRENTVRLILVAVSLVTINTLVSSLAASTLDPNLWLIFIKTTVITGPLAASIILHYSFLLLKRGTIFEHKTILVIYLGPLALISMLLIASEFVYPEVVAIPNGSNYGIYGATASRIPFFWAIYNLYQGFLLIFATINFIQIYKQASDLERKRAAYFILALLAPAIALILTSFLNYLGIGFKLELSTVATAIAMSIITIGILKAQLFDIDLILSQSVRYTFMNVGLAWIFVLSREILTPLISAIIFRGSQVATLIAGFIVITVLAPIKNFTSNLTDKLFPQFKRSLRPPLNKLEIYRTQLESVWSDGNVTTKEKRTLDTLRHSLGISLEEHEQLELEIRSEID